MVKNPKVEKKYFKIVGQTYLREMKCGYKEKNKN